MGAFKESEQKLSASKKKDARGEIVIRIDLQNSAMPVSKHGAMPSSGNLRELVVITDATVSEVAEAIREALFGDSIPK